MDVLRPIRQVEKQLRRGRDFIIAHLEQNFADQLTECCTAWFARHHTVAVSLAKILLSGLNLRGLARPIAALEGDETNHQLKQ